MNSSMQWLRRPAVLLSVAGSFVVAGGIVASYPLWAGGLARAKIEEKLANRLGCEVALEGVDLGYHSLRIEQIQLSREHTKVVATGVVATWQSWGVPKVRDIERIEIESGSLAGSLDDLQRWRAAVDAKKSEPKVDASPVAAVSSPSLPQVMLKGFTVDVTTDGAIPRLRRLTSNLVASLDGSKVDVELHELTGQMVSGRSLSFAKIHTQFNVDVAARAPVFPVHIQVEDGRLPITPNLVFAGVRGDFSFVDMHASQIEVDLHGGFSDASGSDAGELWAVKGAGRRDLSAGQIRLQMDEFELGKVPRVLAALPLIDSQHATIGGDLALDIRAGKVDAKGALSVKGLNIESELLAAEVVRDIGFSLELDASYEPSTSELVLRKFAAMRNALRIEVSGTMRHTPELATRRYDLNFVIPPSPCQDLLDAIPPELVPSLRGVKLGGNYELESHLLVDFADLQSMELTGLKGSFGLRQCRPVVVPKRLSAPRLMGDLVHRVTLRDGSEKTLYLSPINPGFAPLEEISPSMVAAVMTTEDGGFWRHDGFLTSQIVNALRSNLEAGAVRLGASTITMQTVKNVFLSHERTLARKLQEVFLTWYVEKTLPKERIMELYLNVAEFGPGIYGITAAAAHYFEKRPGDLTSLDAAYLALMLPSPVRRHEHYCNGKLSRSFEVKLRRIHGFMASRGHISAEDYELWKDAELVFSDRDRHDPRECLRTIKDLLAAQAGQMALSGLMAQDVPATEMRSTRWRSARPPGGPRYTLHPTVTQDAETVADDGL